MLEKEPIQLPLSEQYRNEEALKIIAYELMTWTALREHQALDRQYEDKIEDDDE